MKLDILENEADIEKSEDFESMEYGIAKGQGALLFKILSQYSNPIGSLVRETVTNAFDSHIEADYDGPITVRINSENKLTGKDNTFEVEDYGVGLSPKRVKTIYSKFLASTKRTGNKQHGAFGLGSKSPLSYCEMFYVITRFEGKEYVYTIHKARKAPKIEMMDKYDTEETNGTKVVVPIKRLDKYKFKKEVKRQLQYFDNINYEGCDIDNDYKIYRGKNFMYREDSTASNVHIALGKVYYPIDWNSLRDSDDRDSALRGFRSYNYQTPIALRFEIGDLPVVWNRENIEYTDKAITAIKEKLKAAKKELQEIYDKKHSGVTSVKEFLKARKSSKTKSLEIVDGVSIPNINDLVDAEATYPKYADKLPKIPTDLFFDYYTHRYVEEGLVKSHQGLPKVLKLWNKGIKMYYCEDQYKTKTNKYIYHKLDDPKFYIVRKHPDNELKDAETLATYFGMNYRDTPTKEQIQAIKDLRKEVDDFVKSELGDYGGIDVPDSFKQWLKDQRGTGPTNQPNYDPNKEVPYKPVSFDTDSYDHNNFNKYSFNREYIKIKDLVESDTLMIYGHRDDADKLTQIAALLFSREKFHEHGSGWSHDIYMTGKQARIFKISMSNAKLIEDKPNAYHVDDFMESEHKILVKFVTAKHLVDNVPSKIWDLNVGYVKKVNEEFADLLSDLSSYKKNYYDSNKFSFRCDDFNAVKALCEKHNLLDDKILKKLKLAEAYFDKFPLIQYVSIDSSVAAEEFKIYMDAKGEVHPLLLQRLQEYKQQKQKVNNVQTQN